MCLPADCKDMRSFTLHTFAIRSIDADSIDVCCADVRAVDTGFLNVRSVSSCLRPSCSKYLNHAVRCCIFRFVTTQFDDIRSDTLP